MEVPIRWSGRRDSNPRHSAWKAEALPTELHPLIFGGGWGNRTPNSALQGPRVPVSTNPPNSWSGRRDSNPRHLPWQGSALPTELHPHCSSCLSHYRCDLSALRASSLAFIALHNPPRLGLGAGQDRAHHRCAENDGPLLHTSSSRSRARVIWDTATSISSRYSRCVSSSCLAFDAAKNSSTEPRKQPRVTSISLDFVL